MNPEAILALISDLYVQVLVATQRIKELETQLAAQDVEPAPADIAKFAK